MKTTLIVIVSLIVGLFLGFLWGQSGVLLEQDAVFDDTISRSANLMIDFGDGRVEAYPGEAFESGETAFQFTQRLSEGNKVEFSYEEYEGLGVLVSGIGDRKNGDGNKYWQYWVNGVSPDVGAGVYLLQDRDVVEWKFLKYLGNE